MRMRFGWIAALVGVALMGGMMAAPATAHHGWSEYQDTQFEITGTLEAPVSLAGPHATAQMRADEQVWDLVFAPSPRTARAGLTEDAVPGGAEVTASGHRHLDPEVFEIKVERLTYNGTVFNVYPDRD
jgi:hypothetical protein